MSYNDTSVGRRGHLRSISMLNSLRKNNTPSNHELIYLLVYCCKCSWSAEAPMYWLPKFVVIRLNIRRAVRLEGRFTRLVLHQWTRYTKGYHCIGEVIALLNHQEAMKQEPIEDRVQESCRVEQVCRMFYRSHGSLSPCRNNVRTND